MKYHWRRQDVQMCLFVVWLICFPRRGQSLKNAPKRGVNRDFQAKSQNNKTSILSKLPNQFIPNSEIIETTKYTSWVVHSKSIRFSEVGLGDSVGVMLRLAVCSGVTVGSYWISIELFHDDWLDPLNKATTSRSVRPRYIQKHSTTQCSSSM